MPVKRGGPYDHPQVRAFPILGTDGQIRTSLSLPPKLRREDFREGTLHTWREGDDLDALAAVFYGDARGWRVIAEVNNLPRRYRLPSGLKLWIPSLRELRRRGVRL